MCKFNFFSIDSSTKGNVLANNQLNRYFINKGYRKKLELMDCINRTLEGTIVFRVGKGRYNLLLVGGVHGNELASQAALIKLMDEIICDNVNLKCKLHIVPFLIPYTTMINSRRYDDKDMNRNAHLNGITRKIIDYAVDNNMTALCDCHSTDPNNKPGFASVFCSVKPLIDSSRIASYVCKNTNSRILPIAQAGSVLHGAVEDEANLRGVPAITCETVCENGMLDDNSVDFSFNQILSFLDYFGVI